jgi:NAD(P)-dependent dehydrogenase (short-subunit alcohol dehydrogenase family)
VSVVLITGAGQGLGREVARRLAAGTVFVSACDTAKARRTAEERPTTSVRCRWGLT